MAAALVGGAFLSAFLDVLFDRLASPDFVDLIRGKKLSKKLLQKLETTLRVVGAVLDDAEKKQITNTNVKHWLNDLKHAVYEADDLLDHVFTKAATQNKVRDLFSRFSDSKIVSKLEDIVVTLESHLKLKESLDLKESAVENLSWKAPSTSLEDGSHIYGREKDMEAIIKLLSEDNSDGSDVSVVPIVGMGGVGKTTLAQLVYNDENLKQIFDFDFKAWVCVSQEFDVLKVTKTIIEAVTGKPCKLNDLNLLHLELMDKLKDKKFLIVLDDVWTEDYVDWSLLKKPFNRGIRRSKILLTTRSEKTASIVQTVHTYHLNQLSNEDCWSVFANHACLSSESNENTTTLEKIGKEIVKKCNGLPLAAQSLGGMLRRKHDIGDWNNILNNDIWDLSESECKVIPALRLSYHYLPPHLKRCFVYCSLYPQDYQFDKNELILFWMAEDLLKKPRNGRTLEEVGHEYFDDLVSRSFFQRSSTIRWSWPYGKCFVMHDLMHDLATSLGGDFYFRSEELGKETKINTKTRHLSFTKFNSSVLDNSDVVGRAKFLRTFLSIINFEAAPFNNEEAQCIIVSKLMYLRVLSFCDFQSLDSLPDSIGKLIHLRYLDLSDSSVETLPKSLCNLYNLQTLKLYDCRKLTKLPSDMCNLVNLRHLGIAYTPIKEMPRGMSKLNHLQHLDFFVVGKHQENGIKELGGLSNLRGQLELRNMENVSQSDEALEARMMDKKHINSLQLEWSGCNNNSTNFQLEIDVLCKLQPHFNIESLVIEGYKGTRFPDWMGNSSYCNMMSLKLRDCDNCSMLPSLGQLPSLKDLEIARLNRLKTIDAGFYKNEDCRSGTPFPSLESLPFMKCLVGRCGVPSIQKLFLLVIDDCPKLEGSLPNHLPALTKLVIRNCELLVSSLPTAPAIQSLEIRKSNKVALHAFPLLLETIDVKGSPMVEFMIEAITNIQPTCLRYLTLRDCSSAVSFPGGRLPESLKSLYIEDLKKLEFPTQHKHELLETLSIESSCDSLTSLPLVTFPNLRDLKIRYCENMESLLVSGAESFKSLCSLTISQCPNFVSFWREGLPAPNLIDFSVSGSDKLKSLPEEMSSLLPKLEYLLISNCPEIESFPKRGMPPNLRKVEIFNCEKLLSGLAWPSMGMLTDLCVGGRCDGIKSFPKEGLLPPSLTCLFLYGFSNLEMLDCTGLLHLTSLQQLEIERCPKLENMAGESLPVSLIKLTINSCPLLEKRCRMKHPQIWPKICHIPGIKNQQIIKGNVEIDLVYMFRRSNDTDMVDWPGETVPTHESKFKFELVLNIMAAALVGGAFLSAFLDVLFDRLASPDFVDLIRGKKLSKKLLQKLETTLRVVGAVLDDAEKKQITNTNVKHWLDDLKDAVYEADDLLDHVFTKAATQNKVRDLISRFSDRKIVSKLEDIVVTLESHLKLKENLDLKESAVENLSWKAPSTSLEDGSHIYGREKDKEAIIKLLSEDNSDGSEVSVVPIVGMGGVGKTTLAQLVYNDENLKQIFDFKAWVCVSQEFDVLKVTKTIIEAVTGKPCNLNDLNLLHLELMDKLKDKKFLIVLDDVWTEDYVDWRLLKKPFNRGIIRRSKILLTTRSEKTASVVQTVHTYHLNQLSNEDCWSVFANHACLYSESNGNTTTLEKIGKKIVKKCDGLPLAAESLGGMLRRKHDIVDWNNILNSDIWELSESECKVIPALRLSYHYLPPHLKRCFVYCSLYPQDYEFEKNELILLWMAEDLLKKPRNGRTLEEVGHEYFDDLVSRSFFQRSNRSSWSDRKWFLMPDLKHDRKWFVMHDLMHDLATSLGGDFYFRSEELGKETKIDTKTRHLSFSKFNSSFLDNPDVVGRVKFLRTFLSIIKFAAAPFNNEEAQCIIMSKLMYLRVLSFHDFKSLDSLPDSIGKLIHLRYLDLSFSSIETLPKSLCNLYNLQTLKLYNCRKLTKLPSDMRNLVNLRHLGIAYTPIEEMPRGMSKLNHLQHLDFFAVGKHQENGIKELGGLSNLRGQLELRNMENVSQSDEASEARMMDKKHINSLWLEWSRCNNNSTNFQLEIDVLCKLQPHFNIESLGINGYKGIRFPDWMGNSSYCNMTSLKLRDCDNCSMLPSLGQLPSLKYLEISRLNRLKTIDAGFYKNEDCRSGTPFPSLEYLDIYHMPCWEVWSSFDSEAFPVLKSLYIRDCPKLEGILPNHLPALTTLCIRNCELLVSSLPTAPAIQSLEISKSNKVALHALPLLVDTIEVEGSPMVESVIEAITNIQPTCLRSLTLRDCSSAVSFPGGRLPESLKTLSIKDLKKLEFPTQHKHELLETLSIESSCDSLTSLPLVTFPNLRDLRIGKCENMEYLLVSGAESFKSLCSLYISECPNFVSFWREGLPAPNLIDFRVSGSDKLKSLPEEMSSLLPKLEHLYISNCPEIESFPKRGMPPNLRTLEIYNCEKLLSGLAWPSMGMLTHLTVGGRCDGIKSFPKEGLLPPSLTSLSLFDLSNLEMLDCTGLLHLTSLQQLTIESCPLLENMLKSLPDEMSSLLPKLEDLGIFNCPEIESFPKRGMPPNLRTVWIENCEKLLSGLAWPSMGMLTDLYLWGRCDGIKSFPKEGLLPPSLTSLYLSGFSNLEMLDCTGLLHLTSLQQLTIDSCPLLENMAGERLPVSLIKLTIDSCPLLEKRCRKKHPQIWPKISHIPGIQMDLATKDDQQVSSKSNQLENYFCQGYVSFHRINKSSKATWKLTLYICFEEVTIQIWLIGPEKLYLPMNLSSNLN
ncbi:putative disease resistance RPP13-like protein 1 [Glycine soja]